MAHTAAPQTTIDQLFATHYDSLVRTAIRYLDRRERAEDVVQDVFLQYQLKGCAPAPGCEFAYLRAMVLNASRSKLRRRLVEQKHLQRHVPTAPSAESVALDQHRDRLVWRAIGALPDRQRGVIANHHFAGRRLRDIAEDLGISSGSVKQHAFRARQRLHDELASELEVVDL